MWPFKYLFRSSRVGLQILTVLLQAETLGGSHAQKDILNQILVWAAIKSKNVHLAGNFPPDKSGVKNISISNEF